MTIMTGSIAAFPGTGLAMGVPYVRSMVHQVGETWTRSGAADLTVVDFQDPPVTRTSSVAPRGYGDYPDAARRVFLGMPYIVVWHLRR